jgi:hypothetical protein
MKTKENKPAPKVAVEAFGDDSQPTEFDKVFTEIPEQFMAELCCRHACDKTPADAIRATYEEAERFWKLANYGLFQEDIANDLKSRLGQLGKEKTEELRKTMDARLLPEDFAAALKIHLGLLDKGLDEIAASEKAVAFPMLLRTFRAFPARNEQVRKGRGREIFPEVCEGGKDHQVRGCGESQERPAQGAQRGRGDRVSRAVQQGVAGLPSRQ